MENTNKIKQLEQKYIMQTYGRFDLIIEKGEGSYVYDKDNRKYLDFIGGIGTCPVGHSNQSISNAICTQAKKLINITNLYYTEPQIILAQKLIKLGKLKSGKCFFCNSGAEANEAAIKLAIKSTLKHKIIAFENGFHGRTFGALSATSKINYKEKFAPLVPGFIHIPYNNINALKNKLIEEKNKIAAVLIEPIQGEAGIIVPDENYLTDVSNLCKKNNILLIIDEVQSGMGRTGKFFCYQHNFNIQPDIITIAKGIANGVPLGVCIARKGLDFDKGDHGSTFGGNNLSCAAANAVIDFILNNNLMENAIKVGNYFFEKLELLKKRKKIINEVKGKGLMIGLKLNKNISKQIAVKCIENQVLINNVSEDTIRFLPPLIIGKKQVDECIRVLDKVL